MTSGRGYAEVIGDPIAHSRSPLIHGFWLRKLGLPQDYRATRVTRGELAGFIAGRRKDSAWRGCNVTMPLKLDALILGDEASDLAITAGAANLLIARDGRLLAGNTDIGALLAVLAPLIERAGETVTLLGNGGAARAALVALRMLGRTNVAIQARDLSAAFKLAVEFGLQQQPRPFDAPIGGDGLVNATPIGMAGVEPWRFDLAGMNPQGWVVDMVTEPAGTDLLRQARDRGLTAVDGLQLLVEQAAASFRLLFDVEAPRQFDEELMKAVRG